ncbi:hypothetical protein F5J12DRAFT_149317 [Pisolithus orientalis]|uniref:uncharacterized protein n=1 Tax=Pisolithus orientalis TaxID=936130 RepID=UPI002225258D|nr:uncharacterized protein F5J12DRAFT_149317 [Pisolithus orientalis]KAI6004544.1 hypothetical protein F5J12DRAFT_149317 [Pisolithus orientalis]
MPSACFLVGVLFFTRFADTLGCRKTIIATSQSYLDRWCHTARRFCNGLLIRHAVDCLLSTYRAFSRSSAMFKDILSISGLTWKVGVHSTRNFSGCGMSPWVRVSHTLFTSEVQFGDSESVPADHWTSLKGGTACGFYSRHTRDSNLLVWWLNQHLESGQPRLSVQLSGLCSTRTVACSLSESSLEYPSSRYLWP